MNNPFPGMNPFLEQRWGDFHTSFNVAMRDALNRGLPGDLEARVEESVTVDYDDEHRTIYPDAFIIEDSGRMGGGGTAVATESVVAVSEPIVVAFRDEPRTERHIEILDRSTGGRVITAIELISPWNKTLVGRAAYYQKQTEFVTARVNLVELDLIRGGLFVLAMPEGKLPRKCRTPYLINVRRATHPEKAFLYPASFSQPLPNIRIPLRPTDTDVVLQLQPLLDECFERGRYRLHYAVPLNPPLSPEDTAWMRQRLQEQGLLPAE